MIDRPKGTRHPRYPGIVYPLDYGFIEGTRGSDGGNVDVWRGSLPDCRVTGVVCTVDLHKRDSEVKVLIGCSHEEMEQVLQFHNEASQAAILVDRGREEVD